MPMTTSYRLLLKSAAQVVCVTESGASVPVCGESMSHPVVHSDWSVVVAKDGKIADLGPSNEIASKYASASFDETIDCTGKCVLPGLVDPHTHPVFSGSRVSEFSEKLAGASYMDIHAKGGGIQKTVRCTRESTADELFSLLVPRLDRMVRLGTTTVEAKSGYGLNLETEVKMLKVIHRAGKSHALDIVSTYLGAHSVPQGSTSSEAARDIIEHQIPAISALIESGEISPTMIDVFHEKGVFVDETEAILRAGREIGLRANIHADELSAVAGAELAVRCDALGVSHLEETSDEGIHALATSDVAPRADGFKDGNKDDSKDDNKDDNNKPYRKTVAVMLPTTAYQLRLTPPRARKMIDSGCAVAVGSDYNPNVHCMSMPMTMHLACVLLKMNVEEAFTAATINAAASIGVESQCGSIEVGKHADFIVLAAEEWQSIVYEMVDPPIERVIKKGETVHRDAHYAHN